MIFIWPYNTLKILPKTKPNIYKKRVAASTQNQALSAIVFLYREVIQRDLGEFENLIRAKRPSRLPVVFHYKGNEKYSYSTGR